MNEYELLSLSVLHGAYQDEDLLYEIFGQMLEYFIIVVLFFTFFCFVKQFEINQVCETCSMKELSLFCLGLPVAALLLTGTVMSVPRLLASCVSPLMYMGTTVSSITSWIGWSSRKLVTWLGLTRSLSWCHFPSYSVWEEAQIVILSVPQGYISIKKHSEKCPHLWERNISLFRLWISHEQSSMWNQLSTCQIFNSSFHSHWQSCVCVFDLINSAWSLNASQMVSDREGIKTRTPSFIHHNLFYEKAQTLQREERENRAAIVSLGRSHRRLFQMTNHRLLPRPTSNQIKHVKTQTEHNYNALLQSLGVY